MILVDDDWGGEEAKLLAVEVEESKEEWDGEISVMNLYEMEDPTGWTITNTQTTGDD